MCNVDAVSKLSADSVSVASGDSRQQLPYHMILDDNTSVGRASYLDTEELLGGDGYICKVQHSRMGCRVASTF